MRHSVSLLALLAVGGAPLAAQANLPIGASASGTTSSDAAAVFRYTPPGAGVLTIVVRGNDDLTIRVSDVDGQPLPEGSADTDHNGNTGLEFLALPVGNTDPLQIEVALLSDDGGSGAFTISASFLREDGFARASDPDRRPSLAKVLTVGNASDETLNPDEGDYWDWFSVTAREAMTIAVVTRMTTGTEGDLVVEAFADGNYAESVARSDQDLQGHTGNESVSFDLKAGQTVHIKVAALFESGGNTPYRISVGRVP